MNTPEHLSMITLTGIAQDQTGIEIEKRLVEIRRLYETLGAQIGALRQEIDELTREQALSITPT